MVSKHNLGSAYEFQPICYQENKKKKHKKKNKRSIVMEGIIFISSLFRSMRDLTKDVKKIRMDRNNETTIGFQYEKGPCTSYQQMK